jgi:phospholipid transport system substrate-binding protein
MMNSLVTSQTRRVRAPIAEEVNCKPLATAYALVGALFFSVLTSASPTYAADEGAINMVRTTVNQAMELNHQLPQAERRRRLIDTVARRFDFADMARSSLGDHWKTLTPQQQTEFTQTYTSFMENAYLNKLEGYSGQKVEFLNSLPTGIDNVLVKTRVIDPSREVSLPFGTLS